MKKILLTLGPLSILVMVIIDLFIAEKPFHVAELETHYMIIYYLASFIVGLWFFVKDKYLLDRPLGIFGMILSIVFFIGLFH